MVVQDVTSQHHNVEHYHDFTYWAVCVAALVTTVIITVLGLYQKLAECCRNLRKKTKREEQISPAQYQPLPLYPNAAVQKVSHSALRQMHLHQTAEFTIPGMISSLPIQPMFYDGSNSSISSSEDGRKISPAFEEEYIQPDPREGFQKMFLSANPSLKHYSSSMDIYESQLKPELYESNLDLADQSRSFLGKVRYTLQYEDNTKKKLNMIVQMLTDLRFTKAHENVENLFLLVTLLPEREYVYKTNKLIEVATNLNLFDKFSFHSRPRNRDFESRTIVVAIVYVTNAGKEIPYGEARLPLLNHEIYSQVQTDVSVAVKEMVMNEMGDAQIQLSYSSNEKELTIFLKAIHFSDVSWLDKVSSLQIKTYLLISGDKKDEKTKKKSLHKTIRVNEARYIELQEPMSFSLLPRNVDTCTIKISIHGKHKTLVKRMCMGKVKIGNGSSDECGKAHWRQVMSAKDIAWSMWHPIYGN